MHKKNDSRINICALGVIVFSMLFGQVIANENNYVSYKDYYPEHPRPVNLYHGVGAFQMDELDAILVLLNLRPYAVISNYGLSYLTYTGDSLTRKADRLAILRSKKKTERATNATTKLIEMLKANRMIEYAIDYLYVSPEESDHKLKGGEGYPPMTINSYKVSSSESIPPFIEADPNGMEYTNKYPDYYRINIYTSKHIEVSQLFGKIVLKINDFRQRGLSLPRYAQYKHGIEALFDKRAVAYNGVTNNDEYVFPAYIASDEVAEVYVQADDFREREYGNRIQRKYTRQLINGKPMVTLQDVSGRFLMQFIADGLSIKYSVFSHPGKEEKYKGNEVIALTSLINAYNLKIVK